MSKQAERYYVFKFSNNSGSGVEYGVRATNEHLALIEASELLFMQHGWMSDDLSNVKCIDYGENYRD
jgi:hypothetical protein